MPSIRDLKVYIRWYKYIGKVVRIDIWRNLDQKKLIEKFQILYNIIGSDPAYRSARRTKKYIYILIGLITVQLASRLKAHCLEIVVKLCAELNQIVLILQNCTCSPHSILLLYFLLCHWVLKAKMLCVLCVGFNEIQLSQNSEILKNM